ncbi:argininosuccinate lyase [Jannaschia sp. S6380]|nr:argininosuccinate lyase [Jannaschia sp. S6380]MCK0169218.1 argininosuccinate lyase [Jannaschia sp. S6380]
MIRLIPLVLLLTACGVDGPPIPPSEVEEERRPGVTISGSVEAGLVRTF